MWSVVAIALLALTAHAEDNAATEYTHSDQMKSQNYDMAVAIADQAAIDEWIQYNEDIDPKMAAAADAWAASVKAEQAGHSLPSANHAAVSYPSAETLSAHSIHLPSAAHPAISYPSAEELAETSTSSIGLPAVALSVFFVGSVLSLAVHRLRSSTSTENKEAFIAGYAPF